jgi:ketosteroid isomerase-like protein
MKHLPLLIALIATSSVFAFAQPAKSGKNNNASTAKAEKEIRRILNERIDVFRDAANLVEGINTWNEKYFNKDAITTTTANRVLRGEQKLINDQKGAVPTGLEITSLALDQETIRIFGDTAVTNYRLTVTARLNNRQTEESTLFTSVFKFRNRKWQIIAEHLSRIR